MSTAGDGFLAMFDGPQRAIRCAMAIRDAVQACIEVRKELGMPSTVETFTIEIAA